MDTGDWRAQLAFDSRERIVNKIMETLKRCLPWSGEEGLRELRTVAVRFEEKIYTAATSQSDYLRKISLKMLSMETKSKKPPSPGTLKMLSMETKSTNPPDPGMDCNNWTAAHDQGGETLAISKAATAVDVGDWRVQLLPDSRLRIVNKIMETLKRHLPFSGVEGLQELKKIAGRFEEKMYTAATSQSDYLRKISLKMLTMEKKSTTPSVPAFQAVEDQGSDGETLAVPNAATAVSSGDWKAHFPAGARQNIINNIMENLKLHLPFFGEEGLREVREVAVKFEEEIYSTATSQSAYYRSMSLKMLTMETQSRNPLDQDKHDLEGQIAKKMRFVERKQEMTKAFDKDKANQWTSFSLTSPCETDTELLLEVAKGLLQGDKEPRKMQCFGLEDSIDTFDRDGAGNNPKSFPSSSSSSSICNHNENFLKLSL